jgi:hypothetical protein
VEKEFSEVGTFTLSPVKEKQEDWHADFSGSINLDGNWYFLNAKKRTGANGSFLSGKIGAAKKPKESENSPPPKKDFNFDDDMPF